MDNIEVIISDVDEHTVLLSQRSWHMDSYYVLHARYAAENTSNPHIVVRASDTDNFILLLYFASQLDAQIWMNTGSSSL